MIQFTKFKKLKIPSEDRSFNMDRGGVKPLERDDKSAPENRSDSALDPRNRYYQYY